MAVHALLTAECGADATDDAIAEYIVETVRCSDSVDSWQVHRRARVSLGLALLGSLARHDARLLSEAF